MGFISGLAKIGGKIFDGIKSFAASGFGKTLFSAAGGALFGPVGSIAGNFISNLAGGKLDFKSIAKAGIGALGGLVDKFGLGSLVKNLPSALTNPAGLLSNFNLGSLSQIAGSLLGGDFGKKVSDIANKVSGFLGKATTVGGKIGDITGAIGNIFNTVGAKPPQFLNTFSNGLNSVIGAIDTIQKILGQVSGALGQNMLRA
jgi:hypothetical protein